MIFLALVKPPEKVDFGASGGKHASFRSDSLLSW